jgi:branched-chain amino acid transport system ATP-binding protein
MTLLEVQDIHTYYGNSHILKGVRLNVEKGTLTGVLGRNGVGKTTLVNSIMGFNPPRQGKIIYYGQEISGLTPFRIVRRGIAFVPQGRRIFPSLTTLENMVIAARVGRNPFWSLEQVFAMFPVLKLRLQTRAGKLSGGEQQMLAFGRALVGKVDLLMLDEPTEGLSPLLVAEIGKIINKLKGHGISMLLVEQNLRLVLRLADWVYIMNKGLIAYGSKPKELADNAEVKSRYLGV